MTLFTKQTGIGQGQWYGVIWARWGDALRDAGFEANTLQPRLDSPKILLKVIDATRAQGSLPTTPEMKMLRRQDATFPNPKTLVNHFGNRADLVRKLRTFCEAHTEYADVLPLLPQANQEGDVDQSAPKAQDGYVYLFQSGNHYKIGRTSNLERRVKEVRVAMPEALEIVHHIVTDDPPGIEAYWHKRFERQRVRPDSEWFALSRADVAAFRRRKFQ